LPLASAACASNKNKMPVSISWLRNLIDFYVLVMVRVSGVWQRVFMVDIEGFVDDLIVRPALAKVTL